MTVTQLRQQHSRIEYRAASSRVTDEGLELQFEFHLEPDITFRPRLTIIGVTEADVSRLSPDTLQWYTFHIGLVELLSYWKVACPPEIVITAGRLRETSLHFWHKLLIKGLGEFFYVNGIDFTPQDFVRFTGKVGNISINSHQNTKQNINRYSNRSILVPIGGGKDSVVTLGLLSKAAEFGTEQLVAFHLNPTLAAQDCNRVSGVSETRVIKRVMDPQLAELNKNGYLNGHTPFSSLVAFLTTLTAHVFGYKYIALSNERSSNEGNSTYRGTEINHQYTKTYEFEKDFQDYLGEYLAPLDPTYPRYFSFLRPWYELQIAQAFATFPEYHEVFRSCNRGRQTNSWCGECPKCLFAYLILSPFIAPERMVELFGQNLLDKLELETTALELMGKLPQKPLECVGTREESLVATHLAKQQYLKAGLPLPRLLAKLDQDVLSRETELDQRAEALLNSWNSEHSLPPECESVLKRAIPMT